MTLLAGLLAVSLGASAFGLPEYRGQLMDPALSEASGMCASRLHPDLLWLVNDSGSGAELLAIDLRGRLRARIAVQGIINRDWEALSCFVDGTKPRLAIADTGDNELMREDISIVILDEPADLSVDRIPATRIVQIVMTGGPVDSESMAVLDNGDAALIITKRRVPPEAHLIDLRAGDHVVSQPIGTLAGIPRPTDADRAENPTNGQWSGQPTDASLLPDGAGIAILTYTDTYIYLRAAGTGWDAVFDQQPVVLDLPPILQAEAFTFTRDGKSLIITSEKWPAPLLALSYSGFNNQP